MSFGAESAGFKVLFDFVYMSLNDVLHVEFAFVVDPSLNVYEGSSEVCRTVILLNFGQLRFYLF